MPAEATETLCRVAEDQISFSQGAVSLELLLAHSDRSRLLRDLRDQTDVCFEVPLALSMQEAHAWKACVDACAAQPAGSGAPLAALEDDTLVLCWKVSSTLTACVCCHCFESRQPVIRNTLVGAHHLAKASTITTTRLQNTDVMSHVNLVLLWLRNIAWLGVHSIKATGHPRRAGANIWGRYCHPLLSSRARPHR